MLRILTIGAGVVLILHGLIDLMGTAVYSGHAEIKGLGYKTNLVGGRWERGEAGIRVFGVMWMLPAIGFVAGAIGLMEGWDWARPLVVTASLLSLALTALDWSNAFRGTIIDILTLVLVVLGPRFAAWFS